MKAKQHGGSSEGNEFPKGKPANNVKISIAYAALGGKIQKRDWVRTRAREKREMVQSGCRPTRTSKTPAHDGGSKKRDGETGGN